MDRRMLIITNPGKPNAANYCAGVYDDAENYKEYFTSSAGGCWYDNEIKHLDCPSKSAVMDEVQMMQAQTDFCVVIFSGHGYSQYGVTYVECCPGQNSTNDISEYELQLTGKRQLLILDCCRKPWYPVQDHIRKSSVCLDESVYIKPNTRKEYEKLILNTPVSIEKLFSCSLGEVSNDQEGRGGAYSYTLLNEARLKYNDIERNTYVTVPRIHNNAKKAMEKIAPNQHPRIDKPRSEPYFPFVIKL